MRKYHITNWSKYNQALINRGNICFWISQEVIDNWQSKEHTREKGRPETYSDGALLAILALKSVFKLSLRMLVGFVRSIFYSMNLSIPVPSFSQISRRAKDLYHKLPKLSSRKPTDIVVDSTGLKVYGEGEWKVRAHGVSKRRTWRKLHVGLDPKTHEIIVHELTSHSQTDHQVGQQLIHKGPKSIKRCYADGAYDPVDFRQTLADRHILPVITPPVNAKLHPNHSRADSHRNEAILQIKGLGGDEMARKLWRLLKHYHKRSLVETCMYRLKQIFGPNLTFRDFLRQKTEAFIRCFALNQMTKMGMPCGFWK